MVAAGPLSQPMGSCPPSHCSQSINSNADCEVESPSTVLRMKSKIMLPRVEVNDAFNNHLCSGYVIRGLTFERGSTGPSPLGQYQQYSCSSKKYESQPLALPRLILTSYAAGIELMLDMVVPRLPISPILA